MLLSQVTYKWAKNKKNNNFTLHKKIAKIYAVPQCQMCKPEKHTVKKQCKCKTEERERKIDFKLYILFAFYIF